MHVGLTFKRPTNPGWYLMKLPGEDIIFVRITDTLWEGRVEHNGEFFGNFMPKEGNNQGAFIHSTKTMWSEPIQTYLNETPLELLK